MNQFKNGPSKICGRHPWKNSGFPTGVENIGVGGGEGGSSQYMGGAWGA